MAYRLATVRSGPDRGLFRRLLKKTGLYGPAPLDHFNKSRPFSPAFLSLENEDCKKDWTVSIYICIIHSCRILSIIVLLPSLTPDSTWLRSKSHFHRILGVIMLLPKRYS